MFPTQYKGSDFPANFISAAVSLRRRCEAPVISAAVSLRTCEAPVTAVTVNALVHSDYIHLYIESRTVVDLARN